MRKLNQIKKFSHALKEDFSSFSQGININVFYYIMQLTFKHWISPRFYRNSVTTDYSSPLELSNTVVS